MYIEIKDHGLMLSDYFSGMTGVMIPLYVDNNSSVSDIINMLESELNIIWDHVYFTAMNHEYNIDNLENDIDNAIALLKSENADRMHHKPFKNNEFSDDEDDENPMLIITIEFIKK